jgi:hypothetical protein
VVDCLIQSTGLVTDKLAVALASISGAPLSVHNPPLWPRPHRKLGGLPEWLGLSPLSSYLSPEGLPPARQTTPRRFPRPGSSLHMLAVHSLLNFIFQRILLNYVDFYV